MDYAESYAEVEGSTAVVGSATPAQVGVVEAHDFQDVDSIVHHLILAQVQIRDRNPAEVLGRGGVSGNYWTIVFVHLQMGPLRIYKKLEELNCMVYRISSNRYHGGCWGRYSCILYYRLLSALRPLYPLEVRTFLTIMVLWVYQ
jgi:hypothetical protein